MAITSNSGTITTSTSAVSLALNGANDGGVITFSGTYAGVSVVFETSNDNTNWVPLLVYQSSNLYPILGQTVVLGTNASSAYLFKAGCLEYVRARATAYSSGTANVTIEQIAAKLLIFGSGVLNFGATNVAKATATIVAGTGSTNTNLVAGQGVVHRTIVTTLGSAAYSIYDSATSSIAGLSPLYTSGSAPALGAVTELNLSFSNGITIAQASGSPPLTVGYSLI